MKKTLLLFLLIAGLGFGSVSRAEDNAPASPSTTTGQQTEAQSAPAKKAAKKKKKAKKAKKAAAAKAAEEKAAVEEKAKSDALANPDAVPVAADPQNPGEVKQAPPSLKAESKAEEVEQETKNARMKTEEGSKSPFSGQLNLTYAGSTLDHPFAAVVGNPGATSAPPYVYMAGTVSARYRADKYTTMGVGTGIQTNTPFQGPKDTTVSDPYFDIAKSFRWSKIQNRADASITLWTQDQMHTQYGAGVGFSLSDEAFYEFDFGLTVGLLVGVDANQFSGNAKYDMVKSHQVAYDIVTDPYFEFAFNKVLSLRSVVGIVFEHNRALQGLGDFYRPKVYQTLGLGISPSDWLFLYPYVHAIPYSGTMGIKTTTFGLNAIVNLF